MNIRAAQAGLAPLLQKQISYQQGPRRFYWKYSSHGLVRSSKRLFWHLDRESVRLAHTHVLKAVS